MARKTKVQAELERELAKSYFLQRLTQKEIAKRLKVTEKTISKWVNEGGWEILRQSLLTTKETQLGRLYRLLDFLTESIENRDDKLAVGKEVDDIIKYTASIRNLETETSIGQIMEVAKQIIQFTESIDLEFAKQLTDYFDLLIKQKMK
ncbi:MAG TPA: hypothetical protein VLY87_01790 [Flavobacterium sp.]|nr:hypothetical protein [Flavobacterium sp.]